MQNVECKTKQKKKANVYENQMWEIVLCNITLPLKENKRTAVFPAIALLLQKPIEKETTQPTSWS